MVALRAPNASAKLLQWSPFLESVSCASAGDCTAVGEYTDSSNQYQGLLLTETSGTWATGVKAPLPPNASTVLTPTLGVDVGSVSCASAGDCTAVGSYGDSARLIQGLLLTETSGVWATGVEARLPAGAASNPAVSLDQVSCPSVGDCTAVGTYLDSFGYQQGLLLTETAGTWATGVEAGLPAGAAANPAVSLSSVSCATAGNCTAVGSYTDSSGNTQGLLLTETSGAWATGVEAVSPAGAASNPQVSLSSVSCASAGDCTAVGQYTDSAGPEQGVLLTETSGTWATGVVAILPSGEAGIGYLGPNSVSCASAGNCTAVVGESALLTQTSGVWAPGVDAIPPAGDAVSQLGIDEVSCPSVGNCTAAGNVVVSETSGVWAPAVVAYPPAGGASAVGVSAVSCASAGNCSAVGFYEVSPAVVHAALLTETSGVWAPGVNPVVPGSPSPTGGGTPPPTVGGSPPPPAGGSPPPPAGSSPSPTGGGSPPAPAPAVSAVRLGSRRFPAKKATTLKLTVSQAARIRVLITQTVTGHKVNGACERTATTGKRCTTTLTKRTVTLSARAGANAFKLKLPGLATGAYAATITAQNASGTSPAIRLTFTITHA